MIIQNNERFYTLPLEKKSEKREGEVKDEKKGRVKISEEKESE